MLVVSRCAKAANLATVCVSRRLLSAEAYRDLALARQAGDPVEAGLTYVAEADGDEDGDEDEDDEGQGKGAPGRRIAEEEANNAAAGHGTVGEGLASAGEEMGRNGNGGMDEAALTESAADANSGGDGGGDPGEEEEEDDLYGDLYGGLDDEDGGGGADMESTVRNGGGGAGGETSAEGGSGGGERNGTGGFDGAGAAEDDAGGGMTTDVSTRVVMNALKVRRKGSYPFVDAFFVGWLDGLQVFVPGCVVILDVSGHPYSRLVHCMCMTISRSVTVLDVCRILVPKHLSVFGAACASTFTAQLNARR